MIDPSFFERVPLGSTAPNPCSPRPPGPNWRGILIQAPSQVRIRPGERIGARGAFAAIPICGYYLLDVLALAKGLPLTLVVTNRASGKVFTGAVVEDDPSPEEPPPPDTPTDPKLLVGVATGGYFNPNLLDHVRLAAEPVVYEVQAVWGDARSNVVTIEIVR